MPAGRASAPFERQLFAVAGEFEVAVPGWLPVTADGDGAFPVERARRFARIEFLIVEQGRQLPAGVASAYDGRHGVLRVRARRTPLAGRRKVDVAGAVLRDMSIGRAQRGVRPD